MKELRQIHDQVLRDAQNYNDQTKEEGGWWEFFGFSKKSDKLTNFNGSAFNDCYQQQQQQQISQMPPQDSNWNAISTADLYRNIPQMPTAGASNNMANTNANTIPYIGANTAKSAYNMNMNVNANPISNTLNSPNTAQNTSPNTAQSANLNTPLNTIPNPYGNFTGHHHNHDTIKKEQNEAKKPESPNVLTKKDEDKKSKRAERRLRRKKKRRVIRMIRRIRRRLIFNRLRNRNRMIFDPIPGLFPKVLVNRILKEREVEVIVHGPKGQIIRKTTSSNNPIDAESMVSNSVGVST